MNLLGLCIHAGTGHREGIFKTYTYSALVCIMDSAKAARRQAGLSKRSK